MNFRSVLFYLVFFLFLFLLFSLHISFASANSSTNITLNQSENSSENSSINPPINPSINQTNQTNTTILEYCSPTLEIDSDKEFYNNSEKIKIYNKLNPKKYDFIIEYWVEDLFGNILKEPYLTTNTNSKQYTPNIDEQDRILILKNRLVFINCIINSTNISNSSTSSILNKTFQKYIFVINPQTSEFNPNSSININKLYLNKDNTISFGEILQVNVNMYRGDTQKYAVKAWLSDYKNWKVSEVTTTHLKSKFTNYTMTLPIALKSDCSGGYGDGIYTLNIEGLNISIQQKVNIQGKSKLCKTITVEKILPPKEIIPQKLKFVFNLSVPRTIDETAEYSFYIENNHNEPHNFSMSSYVFRGNKKYSEIITKTVSLPPYSAKSIDFKTKHTAESGIYNIMVKAVVDDQKTIRSFSEEVVVFNSVEEAQTNLDSLSGSTIFDQTLNSEKSGNLLTANTIYESTSEISNNLIPYVIMFSLLFIVLILLIKKK